MLKAKAPALHMIGPGSNSGLYKVSWIPPRMIFEKRVGPEYDTTAYSLKIRGISY